MKINTFYSLFIIFYFVLCIAFYNVMDFDIIDELLTLSLLFFSIIKVAGRSRNTIGKEAGLFAGVASFYILYSLVLGLSSFEAILYDFQQQVRPYIVFYCTYILNPQFSHRQRQWISRIVAITVFAFASLYFSRVIWVHPASMGHVLWQGGLFYYFFSRRQKRDLLLALLIVTLGLLSSRSKFFGEYVAFIAIWYFMKKKINLTNLKSIIAITVIVFIIIAVTWQKFNVYYVEGFSARDRLARPEMYKAVPKVVGDYFPFGPGYCTYGTSAVAIYYSPLYAKYELDSVWGLQKGGPFLADAFYPSIAQYGLFGFILFFLFWKRRYQSLRFVKEEIDYKTCLLVMLSLAIESTADSSYVSGKGMGYFMLLAICLAKGAFIHRNRLRGGKNEE